MKLEIFSLIDCPYSMKSEKLLKLYKPIIYKVSQDEKDKYKQENNMNTFPQIFLLNNQNKIKIGGYSDVKELLSKIFKNEKINLDNSEEIIKFFLNK
jgi:glutaredoxin